MRTPSPARSASLALLLALGAGCNCDDGVSRVVPRLRAEPERLAFGVVPIATTTPLRLTLVSAGNGPVRIDGLTIEGADAGAFVAPALPAAATLGSGERVELEVTVHPPAIGRLAAELVVASNDAEGPLRVPLTADGRAADIALCHAPAGSEDPLECAPAGTCLQVDFGQVLPGQSGLREILVRNEGEARLLVTSAALEAGGEAAGFAMEGTLPEQGIVSGGGARLTLRFSGREQGATTTRLLIESNDPDEAQACVALAGDGSANRAPTACAGAYELRHQDGSTEAPEDPARPQARPADEVFLGAHPDPACSSDPEDGPGGLTYAWTLLRRPERSGSRVMNDTSGPRPGSAQQPPSLHVDAVGEYEVSLVVTDTAGLASPPATVIVDAVPMDDLTLELSWGDAADLDAHLIAPGGTPFCATLDCYFATCMQTSGPDGRPILDWGADTTGDGRPDPDGLRSNDPVYVLDNLGTSILPGTADVRLENVRLPQGPAVPGGRYAVAVHFFEDKGVAVAGVDATLKVVHRGTLLLERTHHFEKDAVGRFWIAAEVDLAMGEAFVIDDVTQSFPSTTQPQDCQ